MNERENNSEDTSWQALAVVNIWALALQLPLRRRLGGRMLELNAVLALVAMLFYAGLSASPPVFWWAGVYFVAVICHRIAILSRWLNGREPHSYYVGFPWLHYVFFGRCPELQLTSVVEPVVMLGVAFLAAPYGEASFFFFAGGAACMVASTVMIEMRGHKRQNDMRDAVIEGRIVRPSSQRRRW